MRVSAKPAPPASPVVLADSPDDVPLHNFQVSEKRLEQVEDFPRAAEVVVYNRSNRQTAISFEAMHQFEEMRDADEFVLSHAADVPEQCDVEFTIKDGGRTFTLPDAMITNVELVEQQGLNVYFRYSMIGGTIR